MFFEGSEKKFEIILQVESQSLRKYSRSFYQSLLKKAQARSVNHFSNAYCDAFILSESSLFIWDHRLILITCGKTTLADAVLYMVRRIQKDDRSIQALFFQRKNEFFPLDQRTSFKHDVMQLRKKFTGKAFQFGNLDEHHFFLFHLDRPYSPDPQDHTIEILMYGMQGKLNQVFTSSASVEKIRESLNLKECFSGFTIQDHVFQPKGYSLNALRGREYYTIHVTPQEVGFYISFETNMFEDPQMIIKKIILLFRPLTFDIITFFPLSQSSALYEFDGFFKSVFYRQRLDCGFNINFSCFQTVKRQAFLPYSW